VKSALPKEDLFMRLLFALLFLICMWLPSSVLAEYYQYRDQNGVLRFTDNLADVPEDQRQQIERYSESGDLFTQEDESEVEAEDEALEEDLEEDMEDTQEASIQEESGEDMEEEGADQSEETEPVQDDNLAQLKILNQMKAALDEEFAVLMEEKQALLQYKDSKKNMSMKEAREYQKSVTLLNQRITDFEERRQAYKKEADAFNAQPGK
jgi:hypothetical protein